MRILFVDDDVNVLEGLRNALRKERHTWDMVFAVGGPAAIAEFDRSTFDVVVTDMRMPGMDGAELLQRIKETHPRTARIVLSGQAEREAVMRALPVAHQFLSKPCDVGQLRLAIQRTCNLQALLHDESVRTLIGQLDKLPSAPQLYWDITNAATQTNISLDDIAQIVERDPAFTAKLLQIVNSAFFGLSQHLGSIHQAVQYLGLDVIKGLALAEGVVGTLSVPAIEGFSLNSLQQHSLLTARLAKRLVTNQARAEDTFTAALIHDVGQIILAHGFPERFAEAVRLAREQDCPLHEAEGHAFGVTHAEMGAYLLGIWGLPFDIVEAVAYHHTPHVTSGDDLDILAAVHLADALIDTAGHPGGEDAVRARLDEAFLTSAGMPMNLGQWRELADREIEKMAA
jgi:HD-like signal output (HDOD) protein